MSTSEGEGRAFEVREEVAELEERGEREVTSLAKAFGERRLSVRTMDRPLRLATGGLILCVLVSVVFLALRDIGGRGVVLGSGDGGTTFVSTPVFIVVLALVSIGFAYVFTAATLASTWIGLPAIGVLLVLIGIYTGAFSGIINWVSFLGFPSWVPWVTRAILLAVLGLAVATRLVRKGTGDTRPHPVRVTLLVAYAVLVGGYFFSIWLTSPTSGGLNLYGLTISIILASFTFLVYPILQVTAIDFGEWGQLGAQRLGSAVTAHRKSALWALAALAALGICVLGAFQLRAGDSAWTTDALRALGGVGVLVVFVGITAGLIVLSGFHRQRFRQFNPATLFGVCALIAVVIPPVAVDLAGGLSHLSAPALVTSGGAFAPGANVVPETVSGGPASYSFQVPRGWSIGRTAGFVLASGGAVSAAFTVLSGPPAIGAMEQALNVRAGPAAAVGPWQRAAVSSSGSDGLLWARSAAGATAPSSYYLLEVVVRGHGVTLADARPLFLAIANSFRGSRQQPAPLPPPAKLSSTPQAVTDKENTLTVALGGGLALGLLVAALVARRRWPPQITGGILLLLVFTLFSLALLFDGVCRYLFGSQVKLPALSTAQIIFAVGFLGVVAALWARVARRHEHPRGHRLLVGVIGLEGAVAMLKLMDYLYGHALAAARVSIWAAVVLLAAAAWDLVMSGELLTNRDTSRLPRAARVLGFFGYYILLAATVLFYSAERFVANGHVTGGGFAPESIMQSALFQIALPVLLVVFLAGLLGRQPSGGQVEGSPQG